MDEIKKIKWTPEAIEDLKEIFDFIAIKSKTAAIKIVKQISLKPLILTVDGFENSGQVDNINSNYRRLISGNYKILYNVNDKTIIIYRIFDCRKDPKILKNL